MKGWMIHAAASALLLGCGGAEQTRPPPPPAPEPEEAAPSTAQELLAMFAEEQEVSLRPTGEPERIGLGQGIAEVRTVTLAAGTCYRVLAAGEGGVRDIELVITAPDADDSMQRDRRHDRYATLGVTHRLCPEEAGDYALEVRMDEGAGGVAWQLFEIVEEGAAEGGDLRIGGDADDYVASQLRERHREAGEGKQPVSGVSRAELQTSEQHRVPFQAEGGNCYVVIAVGVPSVRELELRVFDPFGSEQASPGRAQAPSARFCPSVDGRWSVEVELFQGYGEIGVQVFGGPQ